MPLRGDIRSVQVPGAVDGWLALHERYGRLPLADVLAPAIELADDGFPASIMLALASHLVHALPGAGELCPDGPLQIGQRVRLPGIARTLARRRRRRACAASTRASSAGACSSSARGHFAPERPRPQRGDVVRAAAPAGLGPRPVDRATTLAGLPHAGRRVGRRGGRPRAPTPTTPRGPTSWSNRWRAVGLRPARGPLRRRRRGRAPRRRPPRRGGRGGSTPAGRRRPTSPRAAGAWRQTWRALGDGDTTHLCAHGRRRPRDLADPVQRAGLRLPSRRTLHRCLPAQPRRRLLPGAGPPGRGGARAGGRRTPSPPCW